MSFDLTFPDRMPSGARAVRSRRRRLDRCELYNSDYGAITVFFWVDVSQCRHRSSCYDSSNLSGLDQDLTAKTDTTPHASSLKDTLLYRQVLDKLKERIGAGRYPVGTQLPTEAELHAEFSASRYTIREALRRLAEEGMVERRQGSGTRVIARVPQRGHYSLSLKSLSELFQFALTTHFEIKRTERVTLDAETATRVLGDSGSRWTLLNGVRTTEAGGALVCVTRSYVPERLDWIVPELQSCIGPFYAHIEQRANEPIVEAQQEISAVRITDDIAAEMGCEPGDVAMLLLRRYRSRNGTLIVSLNWHPAANFTYRMSISQTR